jgi:hypothetical protein
MQSFFYDEQIRRFLLQFARICSNFQIEYGREADSEAAALLRVPVRYGDATRNAQTVIQENSANNLPSTPLMTFYIHSLEYDRPRIQEPYFVSKVNVRQRTYDEETDSYERTQGNAFTIERLMPVPYSLGITLDIWTSNTNQKFQLLEQMLIMFNPSLEIQSTDNFIDWTSLSVVYLDSVNWSSRTIPTGTNDTIDIATLKFSLPIWISPPAKVKKLGVVERVIASMYDAQGDIHNAVLNNNLLLGTRQIITPYNWAVVVIGNRIQIAQPAQAFADEPDNSSIDPTVIISGSDLLWPTVIDLYGALRPGVSQIRLTQADGTEVIGTITLDPTDARFVLYDVDVDTVPQNTLGPVNAVINPLVSAPRFGLPNPVAGQRYLLTEDTGYPGQGGNIAASAWIGDGQRSDVPLVAKANDIIEYRGNRWQVVFPAAQITTGGQYVSNLTTGIQYEWNGENWIKSYQGVYEGGLWSLVL